MNKGFLTFSEDQPGLTMLKDEPEDLTHLAPTAGDVCVPLDDPPFLSDMLDEFILSGNYCPLLGGGDGLSQQQQQQHAPSADSTTKTRTRTSDGDAALNECGLAARLRRSARDERAILGAGDGGGGMLDEEGRCCGSPEHDGDDPFMYREDTPSRCSLGTDLHSPALSKSPDSSGVGDSLNSPTGSGGGGGGLSEDEMLMLSIGDVMGDDELALRAPYIPMSDQDEALQLLISDDMVMWGPSQTSDRKPKWLTDIGEESANSSLAQLLTNESSSRRIKEQDVTLVNPALVLGQINSKNIPRSIATSDNERTNKRVHSYSSKSSHETKRAKHNYGGGGNGGGPLPGLHNIISASMQNSQLLQQLVSQQHHQQQQQRQFARSRDWPEEHRRHHQEQIQQHSSASNAANRPSDRNVLYEDTSICQLKDEGGGFEDLEGILLEDDGGGPMKRSTGLRQQQQQQQQHQQQQLQQLQQIQQQQQQLHQQSNSVLMNLLVSGCDVSAGYVCLTNKRKPGCAPPKGVVASK